MFPNLLKCINIKDKKLVQDIIILSVAYFFVHGYMLVLTGTFHDDWLSFFRDILTKNMEGYESGRPYYSFVIEMVWLLPGYGYRVLSFITYWLTYIFIFCSFCNLKIIETRKAKYIALICMSAPINDARVLLANYPYALGMLLFWIACYILTKKIEDIFKLNARIVVLGIFFMSFSLNSNLVFYCIVLIYLVIKIKKIYKIIDFIILPVLFYILNRIFFPVYGAYVGYNKVTFDKLVWGIKHLPQVVVETFITLLNVVSDRNVYVWLAVLISVIIIFGLFLINRKLRFYENNSEKTNNNQFAGKTDVLITIVGIIALVAGAFPYVVVRQVPNLQFTGIQGRDSMLLGLGISMIIVGCCHEKIRLFVTIFLVLIGFFHFETWYLNYQREWYIQLAYQNEIANIDDIKKGGNYLVSCEPDSTIGDRRFYTWTGNTVVATGRQNVFMLNGEKDADILSDYNIMNSILTHYPMYSEYLWDHESIDGKITMHTDITLSKTIRIKAYELFNSSKYDEEINKIVTIEYYEIEKMQ